MAKALAGSLRYWRKKSELQCTMLILNKIQVPCLCSVVSKFNNLLAKVLFPPDESGGVGVRLNKRNKNEMNSSQQSFFKLANHPFKFRMYLLFKLPAAFFSGVRVREINEEKCITSVPSSGLHKILFVLLILLHLLWLRK